MATFVDLFAGIGGMRLGFEAAGAGCVYAVENNEFCRTTYRTNFGHGHEVGGDITKIHSAVIPAHDVLCAGFPCQPFSLAGVSKKNSLGQPHGFQDETSGTLFFHIARILEHHRPSMFLLENVPNLLAHGKGRTFAVIIKTLEQDLGYSTSWRVINAQGWLPQRRKRLFIAGFRNPARWRGLDGIPVPDPMKGPKLKSILHPEDFSEDVEAPYTLHLGAQVNEKYTISEKLWTCLTNHAAKHRAKGNGFGYGLVGPDDVARTLSARYGKDGGEILIRQLRSHRPRRLTPRECARLMGFDREGERRFEIPVSDTQAYQQFGNAVAPPVVEAVARHMLWRPADA